MFAGESGDVGTSHAYVDIALDPEFATNGYVYIAYNKPEGETVTPPRAVQRPDGSWLVDGMIPVDEFKEIFDLDSLPGEKQDAYQTLGGFIFTRMGRVPSVSESFEWNGLRFEIVDMDGKRIDKVLVSHVANKESPEDV